MTYTIPAMKANLKDCAAYKAQRKAVDDAWRNILAQPLQALYFDDVCLSPATITRLHWPYSNSRFLRKIVFHGSMV